MNEAGLDHAADRATPTQFALVGAGGFGEFIADALADQPDLRIVAVTDLDHHRATTIARQVGAREGTLEDALRSSDIDAVIVASPPDSHRQIVAEAIRAGKDVLCEKPLADTYAGAIELTALARSAGRVLVVDHVLRYNPLLRALREIQVEFGWQVIRFLFENDAADESLPPEHWFWDPTRSGGILIEHGVHFFDAAAMFIDNEPTSVVAAAARRPGWTVPDLVSATVSHGPALATHTHSFTHAHRGERQLMRLDFGPAEARLSGWIPVVAELDVLTDEAGESRLRALLDRPGLLELPGHALPTEAIEVAAREVDAEARATGRGVAYEADRRVTVRLDLGGEAAKESVYRASMRAAAQDLHDCRLDPDRRPLAGASGAAAAIRVAECATAAVDRAASVAIDFAVDHTGSTGSTGHTGSTGGPTQSAHDSTQE